MNKLILLCLLPCPLLLNACGQVGPLYLPDQPPPIHVEKNKNTEH